MQVHYIHQGAEAV